MHSDAFEATQCGKLPNTVLLSVAFRLLYHGFYECGEIRGNHGYRGSAGSSCEEARALRPVPAEICSEYVARIASAICCTNIFDFTVGYAAVKLTFRCRRRGVGLVRWDGRLSGRYLNCAKIGDGQGPVYLL
jgi:hypothetical protein